MRRKTVETNREELPEFVTINGKEYLKTVKSFGDIQEGELVRGKNGLTSVTDAYPDHIPESMYEIVTEGDKTIKASGNHLWYVETIFDREAYRKRKKDGRKWFKTLDSKIVERLEEWAEDNNDEEVTLGRYCADLDLEFGSLGTYLVSRIALGIGPVSNFNTFVDYLEDKDYEPVLEHSENGYNRSMLSQQVLSFKNRRNAKNLIVGRVITTEELADFPSSLLPEVDILA